MSRIENARIDFLCCSLLAHSIMANQDASANHYVNTMIFSVVAGIISSMLLLLVMQGSDAVKQFSVLVITVEIGIVMIILVAIWQIIRFERRRFKQAVDGTMNLMTVKSCPDYWTINNGRTCNNAFTSFDKNEDGRYVKYIIIGKGKTATDKTSVQDVNLSDYNNVTVLDACSKKHEKLPDHPWTDLNAVCNSFQLNQ